LHCSHHNISPSDKVAHWDTSGTTCKRRAILLLLLILVQTVFEDFSPCMWRYALCIFIIVVKLVIA